jgi:hypothetical protein
MHGNCRIDLKTAPRKHGLKSVMLPVNINTASLNHVLGTVDEKRSATHTHAYSLPVFLLQRSTSSGSQCSASIELFPADRARSAGRPGEAAACARCTWQRLKNLIKSVNPGSSWWGDLSPPVLSTHLAVIAASTCRQLAASLIRRPSSFPSASAEHLPANNLQWRIIYTILSLFQLHLSANLQCCMHLPHQQLCPIGWNDLWQWQQH